MIKNGKGDALRLCKHQKNMKNEHLLRIWLIEEGEDLPLQENIRLMRTGMLARYLSERGHIVTWWASTYRHGTKQYYTNQYKEVKVNENETLIMLHSNIIYKKNISFVRIKYHQVLAKEFARKCQKKEVPDVIICCWPTQQFAKEAVKYGKRNHVPVIIDVRDLWPDIFVRVFPKSFQGLASVLLVPMKCTATKIFKEATGICSMSLSGLKWGCSYAGRPPASFDRCIYIGNPKINIDEKCFKEQLIKWHALGVKEENWNICIFSTLSKTGLDLDTVISAVKRLAEKYTDIYLIVGGKGDAEDYFKSIGGNSSNIIFAGWLDQDQMNSLMMISKCGMYCLKNREDLKDTFSNKVIQYLSGGLPVINSLQGFAKWYLHKNEIGYTYQEGNIDSCADVIEKIYLDNILRKKMADKARKCFEYHFDSDIVNGQFEKYIYDIRNKYKE